MTRLPTLVMAVLAVTTAAAGCGSGDSPPETGLRKALARVAATDDMRAYVEYADAKAINALAGEVDAPDDTWGRMLGSAAGKLSDSWRAMPDVTGIDFGTVEYRIAAGNSPHDVERLFGGQDAERVASRLRANGWQDNGGELTAPELNLATMTPEVSMISFKLGKVRLVGADVAHGSADASLDPILEPGEKTLATDAATVELADCLGDVMAAMMARAQGESDVHDAIAVGVRRAADKASTPKAVMCTAWPSEREADTFADQQRGAVATPKYADTYRNSKVERVGAKLVRLEAETPKDSATILSAFMSKQLPS